MPLRSTTFLTLACIISMPLQSGLALAQESSATVSDEKQQSQSLRVVAVHPRQVNATLVQKWSKLNYEFALVIEDAGDETQAAIKRIVQSTGQVDYLFEVARSPQMAKKHPEWMASIQGHHEWMRHHKEIRKPGKDEVVKVFPWVPIFSREPFAAHVNRISELIKDLPAPRRVWLNNIQGAPSACGCGHPLCRWTSDYGPLQSTTPIGNEAPAQFVEQVKKRAKLNNVIPILTSECEAEDQHTVCGGVGCFKGICWKAFTAQLDAVAKETKHVGVACFYKALQRDLPRYKEKAGWIRYAVESFEKMPKVRNGRGLKADRLVPVLQGWNVSDEELQQQLLVAERLKPAGIMICLAKLDQSWSPHIIRWKPNKK